jgi:hypothetical protein
MIIFYIYMYFIITDRCPKGYTPYPIISLFICLKYVALNTKYPDAVNDCNADDGDLIRIDSQEKFDIFRTHLGTL